MTDPKAVEALKALAKCGRYAKDCCFLQDKATECGAMKAIRASSPSPAVREALEWYGEQARLARLIHSEGDAGRHALAEDGGKRARAALSHPSPSDAHE